MRQSFLAHLFIYNYWQVLYYLNTASKQERGDDRTRVSDTARIRLEFQLA